MTATDVAGLLVIIAAVPANLFPVLYTVWSNWWHTPEGRHLFFFVLGLAAMIDLSLTRRAAGEFPGYETLVAGVLLVVCYQLWRRLWLLVKYNRPRRSDTPTTEHPRRRSTDRR